MANGPMQGVKVIEVAAWVAAPATAGILADWGADVIKVEPFHGDPFRGIAAVGPGGSNPVFELDNRGKRSISLDISQPDGLSLLFELVADADVFITNLRPTTREELGIDPTAMLERFPALIYADVTGYGYDTPYRDRPSYDMGGFWARSGAAQSHAVGSQPPPALRGGSGDHMTANALVGGISAALFDRTRTGKGRHVSASLVRTGAYLVGQDYSMQLRVGTAFSLGVARTNASNPMLNCYLTQDEKWFWLLGLQPDRHFPNVAVAAGRPDLLADERFATPAERRANGAALIAELDAAFATKTLAEWMPIFAELDVWYEPVLSVADGVDDDILRAAGTFIEAPGRDGAVPAVATPVDFDRVQSIPTRPTPELGEHTEEILLALGHDWDRIIEWKTAGVVL